jgi:spore maturation protein SpmA
MKIGEKGGMITILARWFGPFFVRLFPEIPKGHPATGSIIMNFSANMLGLDNAATPMGLKAMQELQELNPNKDTASNAQITFLVLNTSGLSIIPLTAIADRATPEVGSLDPTSIFIPTLIATFCSTIVGLLYLAYRQKIKLFDPVALAYLLGLTSLVVFSVWYFTSLTPDQLQLQSRLISSVIIITIIISFLSLGLKSNVPLFETFIEGAKEGFQVSIRIIPYLVGLLVAIGVFRSSGTLYYLNEGVRWLVALTGLNTDFVDALPVAYLRPLSGQGARAMMIEISRTYGADSFVGNLASVFRGCSETTFYVLAVYFGSVNIRHTRYALTAGLIADVAGMIGAIAVAYLFFH